MRRKTRRQNRMLKTLMALTLTSGLAMPVPADAAAIFNVGSYDELRNAANVATSGDTISIREGTVISAGGQVDLPINAGVIIVGNGAVLDGIRLDNQSGSISSITGLNMRGSIANGAGGAINASNIEGGITNSSFTSNTATGGGKNGGAIAVLGTLTGGINNSVFIDNSSSGASGGAIVASSISDGITGSVFANNEAKGGHGGAIILEHSLSGGITGSTFTGNTAAQNGGAIAASGIDYIKNSQFTGNKAVSDGGAIFISSTSGPSELTLDGTGNGVLFHNNMAGVNTPNSIHFDLANNNAALNITGAGTIAMYDPLSTTGSGRELNINQTGGTWILGGNNDTANTKWNISGGTLVLTSDSKYGRSLIKGDSFTIGTVAALLVVPDTTRAWIQAADADINGTVGVGSDERYRGYIAPADFDTTLLVVNTNSNDKKLAATAGTFALGQYDYTYDSLEWNGGGSLLSYRVTSSRLSAERNGAYAANATLFSNLANGTASSVFGHIGDTFKKINPKTIENAQYLIEPNDGGKKKQLSVWGAFLNNNMKTDQRSGSSGSSVNTPGLIIGTDKPLGDKSFIGFAVSATWPDYEQGRLDADGKDIRLAVYGGTLLKKGWQLGYMASAGKGNMSHKRITSTDTARAKYDISSYTLGLSLAKPIEYQIGKTLKPYLTYEYIRSLSDGYTENSWTGLTGITAAGQSNSLSRIKLGMSHRQENDRGSFFEGGLYWQILAGDKNAKVNSFMNTNPGSPVSLSGTGMDTNALGIDLSIGRKVGKTDIALSYNGTFGEKSRSNTFSINLNYKF